MTFSITFGWWMLPLFLLWACILTACFQRAQEEDIWAGGAFVGGIVTLFSLLERFLP